jgi:hypothetical protein
MNIVPYVSFGTLFFGRTSKDECVQLCGQPEQIRTNREGVEELHYAEFIVRLDRSTSKVSECTLLPRADATIDGIDITWDKQFLQLVCERDGSPKDVYGFIVLNNLGIAVTGIHDDDESQLAITAYSAGAFDDLLPESVPFEISPS